MVIGGISPNRARSGRHARAAACFVRLTFCALLGLAPSLAQSAGCLDPRPRLYTQEQVDNFQAVNGDGGICDTIAGDLRIEGTGIVNLDGLSDIEYVAGNVLIQQTSLTQLDGLSGLSEVSGRFSLSSNLELQDISGVSNLAAIGELGISNNPKLTEIDALAVAVGGASAIDLSQTPLTSLQALHSVVELEGNLFIIEMDALTSIDGLENLVRVGGDFWLGNNDGITDVAGVSNLQQIDGQLQVVANDALVNLDGLSSLHTIGIGFWIYANAELESVAGLSGLGPNVATIYIAQCPKLRRIDALSGVQSVAGSLVLRALPTLESLAGIANVTAVDVHLFLSEIDLLENLDLFGNLTFIGEMLHIENNPNLLTIDGLSGLTGTLEEIRVQGNGKLESMDGLEGITAVREHLSLSGTSVSSLDGLSNIESVGGNLSIIDIDGVRNLVALGGLSHVGGSLSINYNDSLENLDGLSSLAGGFNSGITIRDNPLLSDLSGLGSLTSIKNTLTIQNNPRLVTLEGLDALETTGGLRILGNEFLENLNGLTSLRSAGTFHVRQNDRLQHVDGLRNLSRLGLNLDIRENAALENLHGLSSLIHVPYNVYVLDNPQLSDCRGLIPLLDEIDDGEPGPGWGNPANPDVGGFTILLTGNHENCTLVQDILASEASTSFYVLKRFSDDNPAAVTTALTCSPSTILVSPATAQASANEPARFQVRRYAPGSVATCDAAETEIPNGYTAAPSDCTTSQLYDKPAHLCILRNSQNPVVVAVHAAFENSGPCPDPDVAVSVDCPHGQITPGETVYTDNGIAEFEISRFPWQGQICQVNHAAPAGYIAVESSGCDKVVVQPGVNSPIACTVVYRKYSEIIHASGFESMSCTGGSG